jgi:beta-mannosidase
VLDDAGGAKSAWHALRRVLQPLAVLVTDEGGDGLVAHVVNEGAEAKSLQLAFTAWRDGDVRVAGGSKAIEAAARGALSVPLVALLDHFMDLNHAWRFGPPACEFVQVRLLDAAGQEVTDSVHFPLGLAPLVASPRRDIGLQVQAAAGDDADHARLQLSASQWAIGVHVDVEGWEPEDNHFHLAPGSTRTLALRRVKPGAALDGVVHALNLGSALPVELYA